MSGIEGLTHEGIPLMPRDSSAVIFAAFLCFARPFFALPEATTESPEMMASGTGATSYEIMNTRLLHGEIN